MSHLVIKVGGSLFDLPDLGPRLRRWLAGQAPRPVLIVPGGGQAADIIREYDRIHRLGEEISHWLALAMLAVNARVLAALLPEAVVSPEPTDAPVTILDMHAFALTDENRPGRLPHRWEATSDSCAVRVAQVSGARELILLKSAHWDGADWEQAAAAGIVDPFFSTATRAASSLRVSVINFREAL